ncbi:RNA-guided endonuclease InsQ/TnpB family protein [Actinoplanes awajinensis]|uniref:RNA-guided endonuclease InsQ/TnpB family protein n=1 Tax=Actinoplanes awajinensis TaxID=135946 RepID=UPI0009FDAFF6|nr:RNA-guided endonuclease TnpB family protein [Actinoplanes awajinensis]
MKIKHGYMRRLAPTPEQTAALDDQSHAARAVWNLLHDWSTGHGRCLRPSVKDADNAIRQARKEVPWLAVVPAQAAQAVLKTYRRAWTNFFEGRAGPPEYKSRARSRAVVDIPQGRSLAVKRLNRRWAQLWVPKVGTVRFRWTGPIPGVGREPGRLTGARLVREAIGWHVVFRTEVVRADPAPHPGPMVGIDRGVTVALALSDGNDREHGPWMRPKEQERLLRLERAAARKWRAHMRGAPASKRLSRTYDQIAKLRARAKRRRTDWQHQTTTALANRYGVVVVEDLTIENMVRRPKPKPNPNRPGAFLKNRARVKAGLNRSMLNEAHTATVTMLAYKLAERGGTLIRVPARYTSQTCSQCGHRDPSFRKGIAFSCTSCGWIGHADTNAAINIHAAGRVVYGLLSPAPRGDEASRSNRRAA